MIADVFSIFAAKDFPIAPVRIAGIMLGILAVVFFAAATITMKNSWRVGIPEEKTALVTNGIYISIIWNTFLDILEKDKIPFAEKQSWA